MAILTVRNVPDEVHRALRARPQHRGGGACQGPLHILGQTTAQNRKSLVALGNTTIEMRDSCGYPVQ